MTIREELEVGKITPQIFQLYCVTAIQEAFNYQEKGKEQFENLSMDTYIDIANQTEIHIALLGFSKNIDKFIAYRIYYEDESIIIDSESGYEITCEVDTEALENIGNEIEESTNGIHKIINKMLLRGFAISLKLSNEISKIPSYYTPVFNPVTCFNTTSNQIENIRLTPHGTIKNINKPKTYDSFKLRSRKQRIFASDEGEYCISGEQDSYDNGALYELHNNKIIRRLRGTHSATWLQLCSLIADTNIRINTPLYVKAKESEECAWLYIATNGIIYGDTIIKAGMEYKVIEAEKGPIELISYKDENQELLLPLVANELLLIKGNELTNPIVLDIERVVEEDIFASESEEFANLKANIDKLNNSLIERNYYDGTKFEELLTYKFLEMKLEEERKRREQEEFEAMVKEKVDKFKQSAKSMFKGLTQKTEETIEQLKQQPNTDSPESESPSNEENAGGFKEYYKKHKIGVWIGIVAIILLVSTCG